MTNPVVERVARAIIIARNESIKGRPSYGYPAPDLLWETMAEGLREQTRSEARAAISAMHTSLVQPNMGVSREFVRTFDALVNAALSEGLPGGDG